MNVAHPILAGQESREAGLMVLAQRIVDGDLSGLPRVDESCFEWATWQSKAQCALDSEDASELEWMVRREQAYADFRAWQYRGTFVGGNEGIRREYTEFEDWLVTNGPHDALTASERQRRCGVAA